MGISPWPSGQIRSMTFEIIDDRGNLVDLTGISANQCVFEVYNNAGTAITLTGTGTFSVNTSGIVTYTPAATDSATPGSYQVRVKVGTVGSTDFIAWVVQA